MLRPRQCGSEPPLRQVSSLGSGVGELGEAERLPGEEGMGPERWVSVGCGATWEKGIPGRGNSRNKGLEAQK